MILPIVALAMLPPLPRTPAAAAAQAAQAAMAALNAGVAPRLQIELIGDAVEEAGPLPSLSLCRTLVEELSRDERWQPSKTRFVFNGDGAVRTWRQHAPAAAASTRSDVLDNVSGPAADDALLVLVAPCNRGSARGTRAVTEAARLERVQRLVCGAKHVPVILVNPQVRGSHRRPDQPSAVASVPRC
jgi:hypothetical protein